MGINIKEVLINKINKSEWWHVTPADPDAYSKRGKFLASTYQRAEFYGRPNDIPDKVSITNPIYGFSEKEIIKQLFPQENYDNLLNSLNKQKGNWYQERINLDAKMFKKAKLLGYDSIVLMGANGKRYLEKNRKPCSIELNLLYVQ